MGEFARSKGEIRRMKEEAKHHGVAHEASDVSIESVVKFGIGLLVSTAAVCLLLWGLFHYFAVREEKTELPPASRVVGPGNKLPPEPRLQGAPGHEVHPIQELKDLRAAEDALLNSYGWVDRNAGTVRIPIEKAMEKLLQQGLPVRETGEGRSPEKKQ